MIMCFDSGLSVVVLRVKPIVNICILFFEEPAFNRVALRRGSNATLRIL